jgi:hypothetical protein
MKTIDKEGLEKDLRELNRYFFRRGFDDGFLTGVVASLFAYTISAMIFWLIIK